MNLEVRVIEIIEAWDEELACYTGKFSFTVENPYDGACWDVDASPEQTAALQRGDIKIRSMITLTDEQFEDGVQRGWII